MTQQLEIVQFRDLIEVKALSRFVPGFSVPTLEVVGEDFTSVEEVLINEVKAPSFIIVNKTTLWAELPESARGRITTVEVLSSGFTKTAVGSRVDFRIGDNTRRITGLLKLSQLFMKWMLQSPGSDIYNPSRGGGLQDLIGKLISTDNISPLLATSTRAVSTTSSQIRSAQAGYPGLPQNERLLAANVDNLYVAKDKALVSLRVNITSVAGQDAVAALTL